MACLAVACRVAAEVNQRILSGWSIIGIEIGRDILVMAARSLWAVTVASRQLTSERTVNVTVCGESRALEHQIEYTSHHP